MLYYVSIIKFACLLCNTNPKPVSCYTENGHITMETYYWECWYLSRWELSLSWGTTQYTGILLIIDVYYVFFFAFFPSLMFFDPLQFFFNYLLEPTSVFWSFLFGVSYYSASIAKYCDTINLSVPALVHIFRWNNAYACRCKRIYSSIYACTRIFKKRS